MSWEAGIYNDDLLDENKQERLALWQSKLPEDPAPTALPNAALWHLCLDCNHYLLGGPQANAHNLGWYQNLQDLINAQRPDLLEPLWQKAPELPFVAMFKASHAANQGQQEQALDMLTTLSNTAPGFLSATLARAQMHLLNNEPQKAQQLLGPVPEIHQLMPAREAFHVTEAQWYLAAWAHLYLLNHCLKAALACLQELFNISQQHKHNMPPYAHEVEVLVQARVFKAMTAL